MKFRAAIPIILTIAGLAFAQLLPQKPAEELKLDRALVFKVDYGNQAETVADTSRSIGQPAKYIGNENGVRSTILTTALCATGMAFATIFNGTGSFDCFVIPSKKLRF